MSEPTKPLIAISKRTFLAITVIIFVIILWLVWPFLDNRGPVKYANIEEHFRYGSIGGEDSDGIPYWIIKVLPTVFADKLPGEGFTALGFIQESDRELPISFVRSTNSLGIDVVTQNCATCHVGVLREKATDINPKTREELLLLRHDFSFMDQQSTYGPGRVDTFTSYKTRRYGFPVEKLADTELDGIADYPSIWNQAPRQSMRLHWDGNNNNGSERNRTAALALVSPTTIDFDSLERVRSWLKELKAPEYPYSIDRTLAQKGQQIFDSNCASCHTEAGANIGQITPIEEIATDRGRIDSYTYELASNQNLTFSGITYKGIDQRFSHFKKTNGYTNSLLDGIWLRSPYLHNGSVPTLRDLLQKPEARPKVFYRGYDVFDQVNVGYVSTVAEENGKQFFLYDTKLPSNHNTGHLYGTDLANDAQDALLEYLKTL